MHEIYSQSLTRNLADKLLSRPVAKATAFVATHPSLQKAIHKTTGTLVIDVEKDIDAYTKFAATKVELVTEALSPSQKLVMASDERYNQAVPFYLVTGCFPHPKTGEILQREFLCDTQSYSGFKLGPPTSTNPVIENKGALLSEQLVTVYTCGQKAFATVPRIHAVEPVKDDTNTLSKINKYIETPHTPNRRMKIGFMSPKAP
ncbi:MAG: hypothetical protein PHW63_06290 [Alphaproteobacteria bacterium]|nr:hypothetical protein [Alphaproteobacteria bacterium]